MPQVYVEDGDHHNSQGRSEGPWKLSDASAALIWALTKCCKQCIKLIQLTCNAKMYVSKTILQQVSDASCTDVVISVSQVYGSTKAAHGRVYKKIQVSRGELEFRLLSFPGHACSWHTLNKFLFKHYTTSFIPCFGPSL